MTQFSRSTFLPFILLVLIVVFSGCGKSAISGLVPLEGTVTYKGEPLADAKLYFSPISGGRGAYATTDASGKFKATTLAPGDGILKGQYKVSVSKFVVVSTAKVPGSDDAEEAVSENKLPVKYSGDKTPLTIEVTGKKLDALLELTD